MDQNRKVYEREKIYSDYFGRKWLFPPETAFMQSVGKKLADFKMLDVGIGGGRTTINFAPKVASYTGIDYSGGMITYCQKKFDHFKNATFIEMDARNLSAFPDNEFDLLLFSFNGIDCVDYEGRIQILLEFNRVLKANGMLIFSFHNVRNLHRLYGFQLPHSPFKIFWELNRMKKLRQINGSLKKYDGKEIFSLYDGADHFQIMIFYLLPEKQREDLEKSGFKVVQWTDLKSGKIIAPDKLIHTTIPWIFVEAHKV